LMRQPRQLRQYRRPARRFVLELQRQSAPAELLAHPALEERFRRLPQVEVRIELAAQAFDVQQRLLQQHELRLDFHVEAARYLEQAQQHAAEGDLLERAVEDRLADRTDRRLEFVDARVGRQPARLDVGLGDAAIVAAEKSEEVLRQIIFVAVGE